MKRISVLLLAVLILLCGCKDTEQDVTDTSAVYETAVQTAAEETTAETTAVTDLPAPDVAVPDVVTAGGYSKEAVDVLGYGEIKFTHSVEYPKIDSEMSGAAALNEKIAERYEKIINELKNGEESNKLYSIYYLSSACDGIIFISVIEDIGWQYSEGMYAQKIFYYDAANDKEMSAEEYAAHFGIDIDAAKKNILYTYELARAYMDDTSCAVNEIGGAAFMGTPAAGKLYPAMQTEFDFDFDGIEVVGDEVNMYYSGMMYIRNIYKIALHRDTLLPVHPHYVGYIVPNDVDSDEIYITFKNGEIAEYSLPKSSGIYAISITSSEISVLSTVNKTYTISINGGESYNAGNQAYLDENSYCDTFYIKEYLAPSELLSIVICEK